MLKALELTGFKSFADRTRFEFPPGITVVVGPNGSGKSNIVDAVKWVLGEQSAKSLRGRDMADVIFKGNGNGGRKMMNTAEATIVFDNADQRLAIDAPEVHVTRRVYRSGEGEYLINRQPCRLKDVRDLFRGTGVGTDAYSLIEQGKVDQLLQASPRDRRAIFEEAAGISRFKAKKIETQRRLERVEQNLLRLTDIVEEVESRLRSVRSQAAKARRYREYSDRLQQLRTQVGLTDWRHLTQRLRAYEAEMTRLRHEAEEMAARGESVEARLLELELEGEATADRGRGCESRLFRKREQIAAAESNIDAARLHSRDQEQQLAQCRRQLAALMGRAGDMHDRLRETLDALSRLEIAHHEAAARVAKNERTLSEMISRISTLRSATEARRTNYVDLTRRAVNLANRVAHCELQLAAGHAAVRRAQERLDELTQSLAASLQQLDEMRASESQLESRVLRQQGQLDAGQRELAESRRLLARRQEELAILRGRYSAIRERATVLEELERKQEGLTAGVRQLVALSRQDAHGLGSEIEGLVADLLHADVETARMVDAALGERSQFVVLRGDRLLAQLRSGHITLPGRVGIVRYDELAPGTAGRRTTAGGEKPVDLDGLPGVLGRVDRLVESEPRFRPLLTRILGRTWAVESLAVALGLSESHGHGNGQGLRFVTPAGELVESDGSMVLGPKTSAAGLVSRRAELRLLQQDLPVVGRQMADAQLEIGRLQQNIEQQDQQLRSDEELHREFTAALADQRINTRTCQQRCQQLDKEQQTATAERRGGEADVVSATTALAAAREELAVAELEVADAEHQIRADEAEIERLDAARRDFDRQTTASRIELATSEQRLAVLHSQRKQFEEVQRERARAIEEAQTQLNRCCNQLRHSDRSILSATSQLAEHYLEKERLGREAAALLAVREQLAAERGEHAEELQQIRKRIRGLEEQLHQQELLAGEVRHERQALAQRLREDYGIELSELQQQADDPRHQREAVEAEIAALRRKISNIGAVNMEALSELEELEMRFGSLTGQHRDLTQAKEALERIIHKINADSRRLFSETLEAIRVNFQSLYRKAFGGGKADLVLEEGQDILEAGIDIIATPPGKPTFNNSLLSGGEKALTAVSLLLAIFQYRPSPFCVLDEVDAPFDEANIGRFVDVLHGFLGWTKFVIVTHSKKTMTAATTLYGVTMQESGVSKQVSVRFDDVSEDGHISEEALRRDQETRSRNDDERAA